MQTVILAAGRGTRMGPVTAQLPKPMLPVGGTPIAARVAESALEAGSDELLFVTGYMGETIRDYFGDEYRGAPVKYATQDSPSGTADALRAVSDLIDDRFALLNGDNVYDPAGLRSLFSSGPSIGVHEVDDPTSYGVVSVEDGQVVDIVEKPDDPPSSLANAGAYVFPYEVTNYLDVSQSERGEYELTDVVARLLEEYRLAPVELDRWLDVGRPWELLEANSLLMADQPRALDGEIHPSATIRGNVVVEAGATIEPGVTIEGPVLVRAGSTVGPNAYVRGSTTIGEDVRIGHSVEIKNSQIMSGTNVPHLSYVGDSVLSGDVNFGAGTVVANVRHDDEPVELTVKGDRVSTGRRKFGVVVGPGVKTGIGTELCPGVTLSTGATTEPGETVFRDR